MPNKMLAIKLNWKSKKSIPIYILFTYFFFVMFTFLKEDFSGEIRKPSVIGIIVIWILISLLTMIEIPIIRKMYKKHAMWLNGFVLILSPIASFLTVEIMVSNFNLEMFKNYSFYNLIWYYVITFMVFVVTRRAKPTIVIVDIIIYLLAMINYMVYLFRGNPIIPSDLLAWETGMSVASNYEISFTYGFLIATLIMLIMYLFGMKLESYDWEISWANRIAGFGIYLLFMVLVFSLFFQTDFIKTKIKVIDYFAPKYTYISYGTAFGFVANVAAMETDYPEGYSLEEIRGILNSHVEETTVSGSKENEENTDNNTEEEQPNIIVIMNEAFSDLSMIGDFDTNLAYLPFTSTLEENTTKGAFYISVFGGGTSDTEYEFLTGNSMAVMPSNCVPYQQFVTAPTDSLAATLKTQGYYNIAIHPYKASGYKRDIVYPLLGFDEFLSEEDFTNPERIRSYVSDQESYEKIIEQYETKGEDNPLFIFTVTMQNHGGYSESQVAAEEETVRFTDLEGYRSVEQYLSLLRKSDQSFQTLVDYFSKQEEHTIILLFGDHQPNVYSEFLDDLMEKDGISEMEAYQRKYKVPFLLWANYDIEEDDVDNISANYLSSYLLQTAGLKGTAYNHYLMDLYQEIPVINALFYIDKAGSIHKYGTSSPYLELIQQYKCIGYNNALDKNDKLEEYYYISN
ncbi:MAG: LTA synthase family protein [Mobilitalea sp.]